MSLKKNVIANNLGQGWTALMMLAFIPLYIKYLGMSPLKNCAIRALVDKNPALRDRSIAGRKVDSSELLAQAGPDDAVFITTIVHQKNMRAHLAEIGFNGQILTI